MKKPKIKNESNLIFTLQDMNIRQKLLQQKTNKIRNFVTKNIRPNTFYKDLI